MNLEEKSILNFDPKKISIKIKRRFMCDPCTKHNTVHTQRSQKSEVKPKRDPLCNIERGDVCFISKKKKKIYVLKQTSSLREDGAKQLMQI